MDHFRQLGCPVPARADPGVRAHAWTDGPPTTADALRTPGCQLPLGSRERLSGLATGGRFGIADGGLRPIGIQ
jgi:hypothetical protein